MSQIILVRIILIASVTIWVLMTFYYLFVIWFNNSVSNFGRQLDLVDKNISYLKVQNQLLENKIAKDGSTFKINRLANNLGFRPTESKQYVLLIIRP